MVFKPTISAGEWPQNYALDRVATGTDIPVHFLLLLQILEILGFLLFSDSDCAV
jgi:hypothetical protein